MIIPALLAGASALPAVHQIATRDNSTCFPWGSATLDKSNAAPSVPRSDWWCGQDTMYGFLGFSYPLEGGCGDDGYSGINSDFAAMKRDFGATLVRIYLPECYTTTIWKNVLKAAINNNMGVIMQVAWPLNGDPDSSWKGTQASILSVLGSGTYADIAPYVIHSIEFGTEPIGDGDDGDNFINDLISFRSKVKPYKIPVGISEDWDRPGTMSGTNDVGLGPTGKQILANSDVVHAHIMPYYHNNLKEAQAWGYISSQVAWYKKNINLPTLISETQWAWAANDGHAGGDGDVGIPQYTNYWKTYDNNCEFFKTNNIGWFLHTWSGEGAFDMVGDNGQYVIPNWRPQRC